MQTPWEKQRASVDGGAVNRVNMTERQDRSEEIKI